ncbi:MAG: hypothetical protein AB1733_07155 [Thermodesulfobacteriota bacterium]
MCIGWGQSTGIATSIPNLKVEVLEPVLCKGVPKDKDFESLDRLAETIAAKHRESSLRPLIRLGLESG